MFTYLNSMVTTISYNGIVQKLDQDGLRVLVEYYTNGYDLEYVIVISLFSIALGILIITAKNPVYSILFLIGLFCSISVYLMLSGLYFMGISYLLVYVGAVSILFIFILMLINVRVSELLTEGKNSIPLAILTVVSFNYAVDPIFSYPVYIWDLFISYINYIYGFVTNFSSNQLFDNWNVESAKQAQALPKHIAGVSSNSWDSSLVESNHITSIGNIMYTNLSLFLIMTSLILLLAMVGTIVITVRKNNVSYINSTVFY